MRQVLEPSRQITLIKSVRRVLRIVSGLLNLEVYNMDPNNGIGCSIRRNGLEAIYLAAGSKFVGLTDDEKEVIIYGVAAHELLHLLRTDFEYAENALQKYPRIEHHARHSFANIVEDAAIEYLRSDKLSAFLNKALTAAIGYFWKASPSLGNDETPFLELVAALIQFGDVGVVKGKFKFKEAEEVFADCLSLYEEAITEPVFAKRYELSQQMFEKAKPLWQKDVDSCSFASSLSDRLASLGKSHQSTGKGKPADDGQEATGTAPEGADERRKKTIHLVDKERLEKMKEEENSEQDTSPSDSQDISDVSDLYVAESDDPSDGSDSEPGLTGKQERELLDALDNDEYDVVDEREKKENKDTVPEDENGSDGLSSESLSDTDTSDPDVSSASEEDSGFCQDSENGGGFSSAPENHGSFDGSKTERTEDPENRTSGRGEPFGSGSGGKEDPASDSPSGSETVSEPVKNSLSDSGSGSEDRTDRSENKKSVQADLDSQNPYDGVADDLMKGDRKTDITDKGTCQDDSSDILTDFESLSQEIPTDNSTTVKDLGEELKDLSEALSKELSSTEEFGISEEVLEQAKQAVLDELRKEEIVRKKEAKKAALEAIDVDVESPYYSGVKYENRNVQEPVTSDYEEISKRVRSLSLNLHASFKKVFQYKSGRKSYGNKGKVDTERYSGKKVTARLFYRNNMPEDKTDMAIVIFVDQSGSMYSHMDRAKETICVILDALKGFDVKVKVVGFTTKGSGPFYFHYGNNKWENKPNVVKSAMTMYAGGGTFLGHALRYTGTMLKNRPETHKLYICITDGDPEDSVYANRDQGLKDCRQAVNEVRKFADVIGVGVYQNDSDTDAFKYIFRENAVTMSSLEGLVKELPRRIKKVFGT